MYSDPVQHSFSLSVSGFRLSFGHVIYHKLNFEGPLIVSSLLCLLFTVGIVKYLDDVSTCILTPIRHSFSSVYCVATVNQCRIMQSFSYSCCSFASKASAVLKGCTSLFFFLETIMYHGLFYNISYCS